MTTETPTAKPTLTVEDERRIAEAQAGMAELIARIPRRPGYADEPALVFVAGEGR